MENIQEYKKLRFAEENELDKTISPLLHDEDIETNSFIRHSLIYFFLNNLWCETDYFMKNSKKINFIGVSIASKPTNIIPVTENILKDINNTELNDFLYDLCENNTVEVIDAKFIPRYSFNVGSIHITDYIPKTEYEKFQQEEARKKEKILNNSNWSTNTLFEFVLVYTIITFDENNNEKHTYKIAIGNQLNTLYGVCLHMDEPISLHVIKNDDGKEYDFYYKAVLDKSR